MFPGGLRQVLSQELPCLTCGVQSSRSRTVHRNVSIECTVPVIQLYPPEPAEAPVLTLVRRTPDLSA